MKEYRLEEVEMILNVSKADLITLVELNVVPAIIKDNCYYFNKEFIDNYSLKRKNNNKLEYIPLCDIEMLKNDKWENDKN